MKRLCILFTLCALLCSCERTAETITLLEWLKATDRPMYGHQDDLLYGVGWNGGDDMRSDTKSVSGHYPAVFGWEIGGLEMASAETIDAVRFEFMRRQIVRAYEMGGVNTISWHPANPLTGGNAWDVSNLETVASILEGGVRHEEYLVWLDRLAEFFNSLKTDAGVKVPLLFRPFHEQTGSWFWWGAGHCTVEQYVELWQGTYVYLAERCDNLLWVYSTDRVATAADYFEHYPGDDVVDVLGFDCYQFGVDDRENYIRTVRGMLNFLVPEGEQRGKPVVFSETGLEGIPDPTWWTGTLWRAIEGYKIAYVLTWRNACDRPGHFFGVYPGQVSAADFCEFAKKTEMI